uniref:Uncharacterized protein n=1 Tax=Anopheles gambiae TaxID=7165 RepID=A0A0E4C778_ANOGA
MKTRRPKSEKAMAVAAGPNQQPDPPKSAERSESMPGTSEEPSAKPLKVSTIATSHSRKSSSSSSRISAQVALQRLEKEQELQKQILLAEKQKMEAKITTKNG